MADQHHIKDWARIRNTSVEIAQAIFELANNDNDEALAQKLWEEGNDKVLELAFSKTTADRLFWDEQTIERANV